ncbi:MAG: polyketide synthase dehydratase domain-containing protein, partial [Desulfobacterales bacterium]|nr:polyketide synthase dehydratase domain-containing protein [Desulfobacterales bacterium]
MADFSQIIETVRFPVDIPVQTCWHDHHVEGRVVLPAVEAMQVVAETVKNCKPDTAVTGMAQVQFDKFLYIQPATEKIDARVDIETYANGDIIARLVTKTQAENSSISRIKEHAAVRYPLDKKSPAVVPPDLNSALQGDCFEVSPDRIYLELVPFGPEYHNIKERLLLTEHGAMAKIGSPPGEQG